MHPQYQEPSRNAKRWIMALSFVAALIGVMCLVFAPHVLTSPTAVGVSLFLGTVTFAVGIYSFLFRE